jgi:hypothetical protein
MAATQRAATPDLSTTDRKEGGETMKNATWHHDTMWDEVHKVLDDVPEPMRHFYRGLYMGLVYAQAQTEEAVQQQVLSIDMACDDLNLSYSPSQSYQHAASFYEEAPPPPNDAVTYKFNPLHFLCMAASLDSEASINYITLKFNPGEFGDYWVFNIACTEGNQGVPDDMAWRNFEDFTP